MPEISEIYKMLNWENPVAVQLDGISFAREISDLSLLIQPPAEPSVWEYCAKILCEKSDAELECVSKFILTEIMQVIYECRQGKQSPGTCVPACRSEWRRDETL